MPIAAGPAGSTAPTDSELESVIDKVRKLLARARSSTSSGTQAQMEAAATEAATAMAHAQRLMHAYNVSLDEVDMGAATAAQRADVECGHVDMEILNEDWRFNLLRAIAKVYMCRVVGERNSLGARKRNWTWIKATAHLVGLPTNRMVTQEVFLWVLAQLEGKGGLYGQAWAKKPANVSPREFRYGFFNGAAQRLTERLEEMTAVDRPEVSDSSRAIVLVRDQAAKQYVSQQWPNAGGFAGQNVRSDGGAQSMGYAAGNRVSFATSRLGSGSRPALGGGR